MALILTRRAGETIKIGEDISITVVAVIGGQARITIDAPKDVAVHRQEIYDRIQREAEEIPQFEGAREAENINKLYELELKERMNIFATAIGSMTNGEWDKLYEMRPDLHKFVRQAVSRKYS